jgi:hypothetical protein
MIKGITFAVSTFVVIPLVTNAHKHGDGHDHTHHGHSHSHDHSEGHHRDLSDDLEHHKNGVIHKDDVSHSSSHEHHHDEDHVHSESCNHGHDQKDFYEPNVHKRMVNSIIKFTHADCLLDKIDTFMRPLPFLAQSLISTTFISVVPIFFIYLMNMSVTAQNRDSFTHVLLSFALGGLLGDVFFHTLPHMSSGSN